MPVSGLDVACSELPVNAEGFGQIALGGQGLHEIAIAAFPQRREPGELPAGPDCAGELGPAET